MLLRECLVDTDLTQYSVIMLDEVHERTVHTDVLFGLLKTTVKKRPDLRLIVGWPTSAGLAISRVIPFPHVLRPAHNLCVPRSLNTLPHTYLEGGHTTE